jgi:hypothetical protein
MMFSVNSLTAAGPPAAPPMYILRASGYRVVAPVDSDVPGGKIVLHGPYGRPEVHGVRRGLPVP